MDIVIALTALFNFIRIEESDRKDDPDNIEGVEDSAEDNQPDILVSQGASNKKCKMDILRDQIAEEMWKDYQLYIA